MFLCVYVVVFAAHLIACSLKRDCSHKLLLHAVVFNATNNHQVNRPQDSMIFARDTHTHTYTRFMLFVIYDIMKAYSVAITHV